MLLYFVHDSTFIDHERNIFRMDMIPDKLLIVIRRQ